MRIVNFEAENFKRLRAVSITPAGDVVEIGGKNGSGKSSVLDAIYVALVGRAVAPPKPIRTGEEECRIKVDLGEIVITRKFTAKAGGTYTDTLKVETDKGLRYGKPQQVLDELLGQIGFDPFAFVQMKPAEQAATLRAMVPLSVDLDELAAADASDFANRRDVNRDGVALKARLDALPVDDDAPTEPIDREALVNALGEAANTNNRIEAERRDRDDTARVAQGRRTHAAELRASAADARAEADRLDKAADQDDADATRLETEIAALPPLSEPVDTDAIRAELRDAEAKQARYVQQAERRRLTAELDALRAKSTGYTDAMEARAKARTDALAKAKMPIPGLGFGTNEKGDPVVTFGGQPFEQASSAEQIRASTAIAMAGNPALRVLRIKDGSLLDQESMALIADMAAADDFQLWVEVVGTGGVGVIMEDGAVKAADQADKPKGKAADKPEGALL